MEPGEKRYINEYECLLIGTYTHGSRMRETFNLFFFFTSSSTLYLVRCCLLSFSLSINLLDWFGYVVLLLFALHMLVRPRTAFTRWLSVGFGEHLTSSCDYTNGFRGHVCALDGASGSCIQYAREMVHIL